MTTGSLVKVGTLDGFDVFRSADGELWIDQSAASVTIQKYQAMSAKPKQAKAKAKEPTVEFVSIYGTHPEGEDGVDLATENCPWFGGHTKDHFLECVDVHISRAIAKRDRMVRFT